VHGAAPIHYRFTFPEPEHRWMQVDASFPDLGAAPLELRMSRSSPGRYSLHEFAKNVYDVHAFAADGREVATPRPDPYGWNVGGFAEVGPGVRRAEPPVLDGQSDRVQPVRADPPVCRRIADVSAGCPPHGHGG